VCVCVCVCVYVCVCVSTIEYIVHTVHKIRLRLQVKLLVVVQSIEHSPCNNDSPGPSCRGRAGLNRQTRIATTVVKDFKDLDNCS